jgi:hypothetical protein
MIDLKFQIIKINNHINRPLQLFLLFLLYLQRIFGQRSQCSNRILLYISNVQVIK